jgi:hypothetical protein
MSFGEKENETLASINGRTFLDEPSFLKRNYDSLSFLV